MAAVTCVAGVSELMQGHARMQQIVPFGPWEKYELHGADSTQMN